MTGHLKLLHYNNADTKPNPTFHRMELIELLRSEQIFTH